jgi:hypothetical protein
VIWKRKANMSFVPRRKSCLAVISVLTLSFLSIPMTGCKGLQKKASGYVWERVFQNEGLSLVDASILDESHIWCIDWVDEGIRSSEILFSNGNTWAEQFNHERLMLADVYALDKNRVWVVGSKVAEDDDSGKIYLYDGFSWKEESEAQELPSFIGIFPLDENHIWATAKGIYFFNGSEWSQQLESKERFQAIYAMRDRAAWAVSETGTVYRFDGFSWNEQQKLPFSEERFFISQARLYAIDESHAWAALYDSTSERCKIFFFDGSSWNEQLTLPKTMLVTGIHAWGEKHVWASCGSAFNISCPILFFDGRGWSIQKECHESLIGIRALSEGKVLAVGESGSLYEGTKQ